MTEHKLKTLARYFEAVERGEKTFEVRRNDRAFQKGDILVLQKVDNDGKFYELDGFGYADEPKQIRAEITYLLQGGQFGIESNYCVMGIRVIKKGDRE